MSIVLKSNIVKIGNSQGIRIPKILLEQSGLKGEIEIEVSSGQMILRPLENPARQGWEEQFRLAVGDGEEGLLEPETATSWDEEEWEW